MKQIDFDIIVVGGGHAGVEAVLAASRMGRTAALVTMDRNKLALMSCNPAIGGLGKSHIVKEIDALGGLMGKAIDATGIQFRKLNLSRGPAVWSTRAQADRAAYTRFVSQFVTSAPGVTVIEATAGSILTEGGKAIGIETEDGHKIFSRAVILCTGTFLGGLIHIGETKIPAGRRGDKAAYSLSESLRNLGFEVGRLKTGTPPRLDGKTIDFDRCELQPGMEPIPFFSYTTRPFHIDQVPCHLTYTTDKTKEIITRNLLRSPMFSGQIKSIGPRYCPSIEDKIHRFSDKPRHQIFLEPEGSGTDEIYPNGFSTSLPEEVQFESIRTVIGLEEAIITKPGYAIEYDYCPAYQIRATLETRKIEGLYFAGQINGTSGYEEAGGQGLVAAVNACLKITGQLPFVPSRAESYLGVMIDDLITLSTTEPYRMFTSRAEYRLRLREDNARDRLFDYAGKLGLIPGEDYDRFEQIQKATKEEIRRLKKIVVPVSKLDGLAQHFIKKEHISLADLLKVPNVSYAEIAHMDIADNSAVALFPEIIERASIYIKYEGYIKKQEREVERFQRMESEIIPDDLPFESLTGLRNEAREKFARFRPTSLGQAGRIEGVTTGDLAALSIHLKKHRAIHPDASNH
ncbi:MAG: tRNA uridine-5-carboxymethylaminomethyl(34) synthesis enzyme MnmG [candidate division Zixibacteria bacterium HGW-Zixibacteria-1]|nr:MAG: tRNA uridine-5-carboxymethylaminomethyl(34) synthesis enzyme MnmG [candidate division Zixibacteria bacterium HGW-Zixibacteria-1]